MKASIRYTKHSPLSWRRDAHLTRGYERTRIAMLEAWALTEGGQRFLDIRCMQFVRTKVRGRRL